MRRNPSRKAVASEMQCTFRLSGGTKKKRLFYVDNINCRLLRLDRRFMCIFISSFYEIFSNKKSKTKIHSDDDKKSLN